MASAVSVAADAVVNGAARDSGHRDSEESTSSVTPAQPHASEAILRAMRPSRVGPGSTVMVWTGAPHKTLECGVSLDVEDVEKTRDTSG